MVKAVCIVPGCELVATDSRRCPKHVRTWRNHAARCAVCNAIIENPGFYRDFKEALTTPKINGRSELWWIGHAPLLGLVPTRVSLCRAHEHLHLMRHAQANLEAFGALLTVDPAFPECWSWTGLRRTSRGARPFFTPVDGDPRSQWIAYRVAWHLTGQKPTGKRHELDHVGCRAADGSTARNTLCCNPLHLRSRTSTANQRNRNSKASRPIEKHATAGALHLSQIANLPWPFEVSEEQTREAEDYPRYLVERYGVVETLEDLALFK